MNTEMPGYYSILTSAVRYSKAISDGEKILFSEITCLTNKFGYCTASNGYFAKLYGISNAAISKRINNLEKAGFIRCEVDSGNGNARKIYLAEGAELIAGNAINGGSTPSKPTVETSQPQVETPINPELRPYQPQVDNNNINISIQDRSEDLIEEKRVRASTPPRKRPPKSSSRDQQIEMLAKHGVTETHANDWLEVRKSKRAGRLTRTALEGLLREADRAGISADDAVRICAERGWQGFNASWNWRDDPPSRSDGAATVSSEEAQRKAYAQEVTEQILRRRRTIDGGRHD